MDQPADPRRHRRSHAHLHGAFGDDDFGRLAERLARFLGTPRYLGVQTCFVIAWIALNAFAVSAQWDPYPFILLNLGFSTQAAYAAPLILLAENRSAARDKAVEEAAGAHRDEIAETQLALIRENTEITERIEEVTEQLRQVQVSAATAHSQMVEQLVRQSALLARQAGLIEDLTGRR